MYMNGWIPGHDADDDQVGEDTKNSNGTVDNSKDQLDVELKCQK